MSSMSDEERGRLALEEMRAELVWIGEKFSVRTVTRALKALTLVEKEFANNIKHRKELNNARA